MIKLYDEVRIKKDGRIANVIEIDDNDGKSVPIYLIEIQDKPDGAKVSDILFWCEDDEIEAVK